MDRGRETSILVVGRWGRLAEVLEVEIDQSAYIRGWLSYSYREKRKRKKQITATKRTVEKRNIKTQFSITGVFFFYNRC